MPNDNEIRPTGKVDFGKKKKYVLLLATSAPTDFFFVSFILVMVLVHYLNLSKSIQHFYKEIHCLS